MINNINSFEILMLIKEIYAKAMSKIEGNISDMGLTHQQLMIIKIIAHNDKEVNISQICKEMSLSKGTVSGIVNRLEQADYIKKVKYDFDKRNTYLSFSKKGLEFAEQFKGQMNQSFDDLFNTLTEDEYTDVMKGLTILKSKIND